MNQVKGTVNRVELVGWIGAEPEQRFVPSGTAVCNFRVATKRLGGRNEAVGAIHPHHSPNFDLCEEALPIGVAVLEAAAVAFLHGSEP